MTDNITSEDLQLIDNIFTTWSRIPYISGNFNDQKMGHEVIKRRKETVILLGKIIKGAKTNGRKTNSRVEKNPC